MGTSGKAKIKHAHLYKISICTVSRIFKIIIFHTSVMFENRRYALHPSATLPAQGCIHTVHWIQISFHQMKCSDRRHRYCKLRHIHLWYIQTSVHCNNCGGKMESYVTERNRLSTWTLSLASVLSEIISNFYCHFYNSVQWFNFLRRVKRKRDCIVM